MSDTLWSKSRYLLPRFLCLFAIWLLLTEADPTGLAFGAVAASIGAAVIPGGGPWPVSPLGWLRFVPWFISRSVAGGADVLLRAVHPARPLDPDWLDFETRLKTPAARRFLAATVSLLPGTLVARFEGNRIQLHVIDRQLEVESQLLELERRIAALFPGE